MLPGWKVIAGSWLLPHLLLLLLSPQIFTHPLSILPSQPIVAICPLPITFALFTPPPHFLCYTHPISLQESMLISNVQSNLMTIWGVNTKPNSNGNTVRVKLSNVYPKLHWPLAIRIRYACSLPSYASNSFAKKLIWFSDSNEFKNRLLLVTEH